MRPKESISNEFDLNDKNLINNIGEESCEQIVLIEIATDSIFMKPK